MHDFHADKADYADNQGVQNFAGKKAAEDAVGAMAKINKMQGAVFGGESINNFAALRQKSFFTNHHINGNDKGQHNIFGADARF